MSATRSVDAVGANVACCAPITATVLGSGEAEALARAFAAVADPVRLRLLSLIAATPAGEACACNLVEPVNKSQPTVSHHLKILHESGLVSRERRGTWMWYRVVPERLAQLRAALS